MNYDYQYFSGANVTIDAGGKGIVECAGISYSISTSRQPVYGYNSEFFDVMLPGRVIIQGNIVVNYIEPNYLEKKIYGRSGSNYLLNKYNGEGFDIDIFFGNKKHKERIQACYLISSGKTVQINEQVILEEYGFIGKSVIELK
jgi:hypothetical protein